MFVLNLSAVKKCLLSNWLITYIVIVWYYCPFSVKHFCMLPSLFFLQHDYKMCYHLCHQLFSKGDIILPLTDTCECRGCLLALQARSLFPGINKLKYSTSKFFGRNGSLEKNNNSTNFEQWLMDKSPWRRDALDLVDCDNNDEIFEDGIDNVVFEKEIQI